MKVRELKEILEQFDDEEEVIIDIFERDAFYPRAHIESVHAGFDWYNGKVIIYTDRRLMPVEPRVPKEKKGENNNGNVG